MRLPWIGACLLHLPIALASVLAPLEEPGPTITILGKPVISKEMAHVNSDSSGYVDDGALCHDESEGDIDTSVVVHGDDVHVRTAFFHFFPPKYCTTDCITHRSRSWTRLALTA
jgi:hypothetical protein